MDLGPCHFIPPYLLERIAASDHESAGCCSSTLETDARFREVRESPGRLTGPSLGAGGAGWAVHTAANTAALPGTLVRSAADPASGDAAVDEAATGITGSLALFAEVYGRSSYDDNGAPVSLTVHYQQDYDNAFWDGTQLVFGDGDGKIFDRFTRPVDVLGHEFTHAVTERTAGLTYQGQPGALNESVSDCFAMCLKQRLLDQTADQGDWLVGQGIFLPAVKARALRDMAHPGTAYDDPRLGKDPQVGDLSDYVDTTDDNGGVHTNSGIPNRAFQLAAVAIGGHTWEGAGQVWYAALTGGQVGADTDFAGFAAATIAAAGDHAAAVTQAWQTVGVTPGAGTAGGGAAPTGGSSATVSVRRTGGIAGRTVTGSVDLTGDDPRAPQARSLADRVDLTAGGGGPSYPDMYVYDFDLGSGRRASVPEHELTDDLRALADLLLG